MGPNERQARDLNRYALMGFLGITILYCLLIQAHKDVAEQLDAERRLNRDMHVIVSKHRRELDGALEVIHRLQGRHEPAHEGRTPTTHTNPDCLLDDDDEFAGTDE